MADTELPGMLPDVLASDGRWIYLRDQRMDAEGNVQPPDVPHIYSSIGLLNGQWWYRTYWQWGSRTWGRYSGWHVVDDFRPSGRIMATDAETVFVYGRKSVGPRDHNMSNSHLFRAAKEVIPLAKANAKIANNNNFVEKDTSGRYRLGRRLQQFGARIQGNNDIRSVALPVLESLRDKLNESVHLTIREGDYVVYIEKASPNRMMQIQQLIGSRAPLHVTAVGKMVLGSAGVKGIDEYSERTNLPMYTRNTINSVERLKQECFQALHDGYALDNEEAELDVGCIGVLVYDSTNTAVAGLSLSAPITRRSNTWIKQVIEAGEAISRQLGHHVSVSSVANIDSQ